MKICTNVYGWCDDVMIEDVMNKNKTNWIKTQVIIKLKIL